jgi:hypothetical protein
MPVIPAWLVRSNFNDPRRIPYLLVWKDERGGEIKEAVRAGALHRLWERRQQLRGIEANGWDRQASDLRLVG